MYFGSPILTKPQTTSIGLTSVGKNITPVFKQAATASIIKACQVLRIIRLESNRLYYANRYMQHPSVRATLVLVSKRLEQLYYRSWKCYLQSLG